MCFIYPISFSINHSHILTPFLLGVNIRKAFFFTEAVVI
jgi:hypothetical protein